MSGEHWSGQERVAGRALLAAVSLGLCLIGAGTVIAGASVPVEARLAQIRLEHAFEGRMAAPEQVNFARLQRAASRPSAIRRHAKASLAQGAEPLARISVERLGTSDIVLAGEGSPEQLRLGPVMLTRGPVTILAAHRDTHFAFIRDLAVGDEVTMRYADDAVERYRVIRFETVRWDDFSYPLDPARPLLALATCYPFGGAEYGGPWRRVVWAERLDSNGSPPSAL